jgi:hypothetical protein
MRLQRLTEGGQGGEAEVIRASFPPIEKIDAYGVRLAAGALGVWDQSNCSRIR